MAGPIYAGKVVFDAAQTSPSAARRLGLWWWWWRAEPAPVPQLEVEAGVGAVETESDATMQHPRHNTLVINTELQLPRLEPRPLRPCGSSLVENPVSSPIS